MLNMFNESSVSLESYKTFVSEKRKYETPDHDIDWNLERAKLLYDVAIEFMNQHGPGVTLLVPDQYRDMFGDSLQYYSELTYGREGRARRSHLV